MNEYCHINERTGSEPTNDNPLLVDTMDMDFSLYEGAVEPLQTVSDVHRELTPEELKLHAGVARQEAWVIEREIIAYEQADRPVPSELIRSHNEWTSRAEDYANRYTRLAHPPLTFKRLFARIFSQ
jgi:hypothetical protein